MGKVKGYQKTFYLFSYMLYTYVQVMSKVHILLFELQFRNMLYIEQMLGIKEHTRLLWKRKK